MSLVDSSNNILISANIAQGYTTNTGNNVVIGHEAMTYPSGGVYDNVFIGKYVGNTANNARDNTVIGTYAAGNIRSGQDNVCIGIGAGYELKNSNYNLFAGFESGYMSTGDQNMFLGARSGYVSKDSDNNVFIGSHSGANNVSSSENVFVGNGAGMFNKNGNVNVFIGGSTGYESNAGSRNVLVGFESGRQNRGNENVMIGTDSGKTANVSFGTIVGTSAGANAFGSNNVLIGARAAANLVGSENVLVGPLLGTILTSNGSAIIGSNASVINASDSIVVGTHSDVQSTNRSVVFGTRANIVGSSNAVVVGSSSNVSSTNNSIVLGTNSNVSSASNSIVFGSNVTVVNASRVTLFGSHDSTVQNVSNVTVIGQLPQNTPLVNDRLYLSTPSRVAVEMNTLTGVTQFRGSVIVDGTIAALGLAADYNNLLNRPTALSAFNNDITIPWSNVSGVPAKIASVNALTTDNRVLFYGADSVQTASTLAWNGSSQRLGVGVSDPRYSVDVSGYVRSTQGYLLESDRTKKLRVQKLEGALDRIRKIHGYTYEYKDHPGTREAGVIAQEVSSALEEATSTDPDTGIMSVKYDAIVALLVEAIRELDERTARM